MFKHIKCVHLDYENEEIVFNYKIQDKILASDLKLELKRVITTANLTKLYRILLEDDNLECFTHTIEVLEFTFGTISIEKKRQI